MKTYMRDGNMWTVCGRYKLNAENYALFKNGEGGHSSAIARTTRGLTIRGLNPGKRKIFLIL